MRSADEGSTILYTVCVSELSIVGFLTTSACRPVCQMQTRMACKQLTPTMLGMVLQVQLIVGVVLHVHAHRAEERHNTKTTECTSYDRHHGLACRNR